jgi:hypothetical protein
MMRTERLSPATINHALRCLKVMLKEAARHGIIARDPSAFITGLAERQAERGILNGAEIRALLHEKAIGKVWGGDLKQCTCRLSPGARRIRCWEMSTTRLRRRTASCGRFISISFPREMAFRTIGRLVSLMENYQDADRKTKIWVELCDSNGLNKYEATNADYVKSIKEYAQQIAGLQIANSRKEIF